MKTRFYIFIFPALFFILSSTAFAALAIDASTPASIQDNTGLTTVSTACFTPPANSVLYIFIMLNSNVPGSCGGTSNCLNKLTSITDNLAALILSIRNKFGRRDRNGNDDLDYFYTASVLTSHAMKVSISQQAVASNQWYLKVIVVTGANTSQPIASIGGGRGVTGAVSASYGSQYVNSWGWLMYGDWNAAAVPTPGASQTLYDSYTVGGGSTYAVIQQNSATPTPGTTVTMNTTAPSSGTRTSYIYFEMEPVIPVTQATIVNATIGNAALK